MNYALNFFERNSKIREIYFFLNLRKTACNFLDSGEEGVGGEDVDEHEWHAEAHPGGVVQGKHITSLMQQKKTLFCC